MDLDEIPPASKWEEDLKEGVAKSDSFVFVISPESLTSKYCAQELANAVELNKRIIPIMSRPVSDSSLPEAVRTHNWIPAEGLFADDFEPVACRPGPGDRHRPALGPRAHPLGQRGDQVGERRRVIEVFCCAALPWRRQRTGSQAEADKEPKPTALHAEFLLASSQGVNPATES